MDNSAIKSDFFSTMPSLNQEKQMKHDVTDEERLLYSLSQQGGWRVLKTYINEILTDLDGATSQAMASGLPFEEIGRNAVVVSLAKDIIKKIVNKTEDAKEACEALDGTTK